MVPAPRTVPAVKTISATPLALVKAVPDSGLKLPNVVVKVTTVLATFKLP